MNCPGDLNMENTVLKKLKRQDFDKLFTLLQDSFPLDEYRNYDGQKELLENPCYTVYGRYDGDTLCGCLAVWDLGEFGFIEHFAVAPTCRNRGLGGEMLRALIRNLGKPLCLEVEPPETETARRRIAFYKRNGFFFSSYPYMQPPLGQDRKAIPLHIMATGGEVDAITFGRIKTALYSQVYCCPQEQIIE